MADGLNAVQLLGNLGADPELRMTASGQALLRLRLATSESYLDSNRVRQERTEWHSVVIWGRRAEALARILSKGSRIHVSGKLRTSSWDGDDGTKRYRTEVTAMNIILCGNGGGGAQRSQEPPPDRWGRDTYDDADYGPGGDDDIPF